MTKKTSESTTEVELITFQAAVRCFNHWATERLKPSSLPKVIGSEVELITFQAVVRCFNHWATERLEPSSLPKVMGSTSSRTQNVFFLRFFFVTNGIQVTCYSAERCSGLIVSVLDSWLSSLGSSPGWGHVTLSPVSLHQGVWMGTSKFNAEVTLNELPSREGKNTAEPW